MLIRVGTSGGLQRWIEIGDLVIATAAVRDEGTSKQYIPAEYPAVADIDVVLALKEAAERLGYRYHLGIIHSKDAFYMESPELVPNYEEVKRKWSVWIRAGVLATEMESSTIFTLAALRGLKAGTVLAVIGSTVKEELVVDERKGIKEAIKTAIEAAKILGKRRKFVKPFK
ncbi:hypothetical protein DRN86_02580 [Candidatus Geothermarchaeota archaeon]|nr:MAG: hypothetical protein DRN86_02580 [Candidatus Geothermarchaeota archaeon]